MLVIHHLGRSQSERIVWLCEELGLPFELRRHERDPETILSPPELAGLHPMGAAPVVEVDGLLLAESAAVVEYLARRHGGGRLFVPPEDPGFAEFLYWFHFSNGNLQPVMGRLMAVRRAGLPPDHPVLRAQEGRLDRVLRHVSDRLGRAPFLAGEALTAADVMSVFSLTTMRHFLPRGPVPASPDPRLPGPHRRARRLPAGDAALRAGHGAPARLSLAEGRKRFFFEKKNQKTFVRLASERWARSESKEQSIFAFFLQKKTLSFFLRSASADA